MKHFQQRTSKTPLFISIKVAAFQIVDVEVISLILSKHSFHGYNTIHSPQMDLFYIHIYMQ
jgi:hypothetical protein